MRRVNTVLALFLAVALAVGLMLIVVTSRGTRLPIAVGSVATKAGSSTTSVVQHRAFFLAVGASGSLGYQPMGIPGGREHATKFSYTNDLVRIEAQRGVQLNLHQIGCPGETMASMLTAIDHCFSRSDGQLKQAVDFLHAHRSDSGLVTIDLGFNDVRACLTRPTIDHVCASSGVNAVSASMARVLATLRAAAGAKVQFVGLLVNDPFLAHYLNGPNGRSDSAFTLSTMVSLNKVLSSGFQRVGIPVADIAKAYKMTDQTLTHLEGVGVIPTNVAMVCQLTWMCKKSPWGPDDHPNNAGYLVIANMVAEQLRAPL
ncbi:MAG: SGNH/GDSL hydrolase family protein [Acidimicrobiaceae bacterium]|nr:SGNH/GDSL hydrolase family protein [Acidimicrobiaceae bacterium]